MRTRTSNRTKNAATQKYTFDGSDANSDSDAYVEDDEPRARPVAAARARPPPASRTRAAAGAAVAAAATYLDVEAITTDTSVKGYHGPYERSTRGQALVSVWYGPRQQDIRIAQGLLSKWLDWTVLPPKYTPATHDDDDDDNTSVASNDDDEADAEAGPRHDETSPWSKGFFRREAQMAETCFANRKGPAASSPPPSSSSSSSYKALLIDDDEDERKLYEQPDRGLRVLMGPYDEQAEYVLRPGDAVPLSQAWMPYDQDATADKIPTGWLLDAGGIVTGMDWCPRRGRDAATTQKLALAVLPHADQEHYNYEVEHQKPGFQRHGTVQVWALEGERLDGGVFRPSAKPPTLQRTHCLEFGRARRVRWCPMPNVGSRPESHSFAVLCGDGHVYIIEDDERQGGLYQKCISPQTCLRLDDEYSVRATAMAWANFNRLVVGYSDGSLALWSIRPRCMLSRHPVHHSLVVDVATGYPSHPFLVASHPLGGTTKLVDLGRPTYETTEVHTNAVSWQPNMLAYSDHLQGFFSVYPSANALNTMIGFMHQRFFPIVRRVFVGESYNSSLAVGRTHPYLLIGSTDGSLWCVNPQSELFSSRRESTDRLRIFHHEHRPKELFDADSPASERGASRLVHGFAIEKSRNPKAEVRSLHAQKKKKAKKAAADTDADAGEANEDDEVGGLMNPTRGIVYELLSRITVVEWNPNANFGCWAAAAMASGLVRVIDLGLDNSPG